MKKLSSDSVDKFLGELSIERISEYQGANIQMQCRCKKCGMEFFPRLSNLKTSQRGHECIQWNSISPEDAKKELSDRGFQMLESFEGSKKKVKAKCISCGKISFPTISNLRRNPNQGCIYCKNLRVDAEDGKKFLEDSGFQITGKWINASTPIAAICKRCRRRVDVRYSQIKLGSGCAKCAGKLVDEDQAFELMKFAGYQPQVPYPGAGKKWPSIHILCGRHVSPVYGNIVAGRGGCSSCAKWGFDNSKPAYLYFIHHLEFNSFKVGIANIAKNKKFDRVHRFENLGWALVSIYRYQEGDAAKQIEKSVFKVIREELKIPIHLNKELMGKYGGETETFSADAISAKRVLEIIKYEDKKFIKSKDAASKK